MLDTDKTLSTVMGWKGYRRLEFVLALVTLRDNFVEALSRYDGVEESYA